MSHGLDPVVSARSAQRRLVSLARANPPACACTAKVGDLLLSVPGIGPAKSDCVLAHCRIANTKTIGGLGDRQRAALTERLGP
jgi:hypothetical protein